MNDTKLAEVLRDFVEFYERSDLYSLRDGIEAYVAHVCERQRQQAIQDAIELLAGEESPSEAVEVARRTLESVL